MTENLPVAAPVAAPADVGRELADIRGMMRDQHGPYYKGERALPLQARYRELLAKQQGVSRPPAETPLTPHRDGNRKPRPSEAVVRDLSLSEAGRKVLDGWGGDVDQAILDAGFVEAELFASVPPHHRGELVEWLNVCPESIKPFVMAGAANIGARIR